MYFNSSRSLLRFPKQTVCFAGTYKSMWDRPTNPRTCSAILPPVQGSRDTALAPRSQARRKTLGLQGGPAADSQLHQYPQARHLRTNLDQWRRRRRKRRGGGEEEEESNLVFYAQSTITKRRRRKQTVTGTPWEDTSWLENVENLQNFHSHTLCVFVQPVFMKPERLFALGLTSPDTHREMLAKASFAQTLF